MFCDSRTIDLQNAPLEVTVMTESDVSPVVQALGEDFVPLARAIDRLLDTDGSRALFKGTDITVRSIFEHFRDRLIKDDIGMFDPPGWMAISALIDLAQACLLAELKTVQELLARDPSLIAQQILDSAIADGIWEDGDEETPSVSETEFWDDVGFDGLDAPLHIQRLKRRVTRALDSLVAQRFESHLLAELTAKRKALVKGLLKAADAEGTDDRYVLDHAFTEFWEEQGYSTSWSIPKKVRAEMTAIEKEAQVAKHMRVVDRASDVLKRKKVLTDELVAFFRQCESDSRWHIALADVIDDFWKTKGIAPLNALPEELQAQAKSILAQAHTLVQADEQRVVEQQHKELVALAKACARWAKQRGASKVTLQDAELFLSRSRREISRKATRVLYLEANDLLRSS
jgi:hypothetical protein